MATNRRLRFIHWQLGWMLAAIVALTILNTFSLTVFFALSLIGFLGVIELTAPHSITPSWRKRLRWIVLISLFAFLYLVEQEITDIIARFVSAGGV